MNCTEFLTQAINLARFSRKLCELQQINEHSQRFEFVIKHEARWIVEACGNISHNSSFSSANLIGELFKIKQTNKQKTLLHDKKFTNIRSSHYTRWKGIKRIYCLSLLPSIEKGQPQFLHVLFLNIAPGRPSLQGGGGRQWGRDSFIGKVDLALKETPRAAIRVSFPQKPRKNSGGAGRILLVLLQNDPLCPHSTFP